MLHLLQRPIPESPVLPSFLDEASLLQAFVPPFQFTSFFSPEDTLLCACAAESALARARISAGDGHGPEAAALRIAELTTGSGLVGLHIVRLEAGSSLLGLDVDPSAVQVASRNARQLGLQGRCRFECSDLWSDETMNMLSSQSPHLVVCNPPYVPEPPGGSLDLEAGAGPDGTAHVIRTLQIAERVRPGTMALSWCSLSDPGRVVREAAAIGYRLNSLFIAAICDGEYSGSVHEYLRTLPQAFINEQKKVRKTAAPDGSARFVYLLMAGEFSRSTSSVKADVEAERAMVRICKEFVDRGLESLRNPIAPFTVRAWLLDRWDELRLRAFLHGPIDRLAHASV